jgi:hypothetical protein
MDNADGRITGDIIQELYNTVASDKILLIQIFENMVKYAEFMEEKIIE